MKSSTSIGTRGDRAILGVSGAIVLMSFVVLGGWHAHIPAAVQIFQGLVPMQYNTALCFLALGFAGIGIATRKRILLLGGGITASLMGSAVILEYATGVSYGIDTLFFSPWTETLSANPGRMAVTTAIGFALTGFALFILAVRRNSYAVLGLVNAITLGLALTSLIGYGLQITYVLPFNLGSQMALHTSVAFFAFAFAMLGFAWIHAERGPDGLPRWCRGIGVTFLPVFLVGANALFPEQSWRIVPFEALISIVGVALITLAVTGLTTAKVAYKGLLMFAIPLILLLTFVGLVLRVKHQSESAQAWTLHSAEVLDVSHALLAEITETESAIRGYVIAADQKFLDSYTRSAAPVVTTISKYRSLVRDNPTQSAKAEEVAKLAEMKMSRLSRTAEMIVAGDRIQAAARIKEGAGLEAMTQLREEMKIFLAEEERLGVERRQILETSWQRLSWLLVAGTSGAILLTGILSLSFSGGISRRLQRLRNNATGLAAGRALAPPLTGHDEIADLDRVFHEMAGLLNAATRHAKAKQVREGEAVDVRHSEALLQAGALQNAIFNSANFSSIATDAKGVIQIFNVGAERMLGYAGSEVTNRITPADISDPQEVIARAKELSAELGTEITPGFEALVFKASRGIEDIYELTYIRKDGSRFPAVVSVTALRDPQDAIIGYLLIGTDNTARKQAEEALLKAGALQSAIFNSANFSSIATDEKGVIQIFNVGAERMLGYTAAEVMNRITPADISDPQEVIARAKELSSELGTEITPGFEALVFKASRGIEDIYELTYIRKDGSRFGAVVSVTALRDAEDGIIGYLLIGTDNTARQQIEEERQKLDQRLRDQQFYTRSLIESNIDALMTTDPLGIITDVNNQMESLTGCTRDELIGAPFKNYFTDPERAKAGIKLALREKTVTNYELTAHAWDGRETVVSYNATTFYDRDRKLQGVFASARDVTERKAAEQIVAERTVQLEYANNELQAFSYSVSHDLRAPLRHIIGFVTLLQEGAGTTLSEKNHRYLTTISEAAKRMGNLIDDLLSFSRVGRAELQKVDVDLDTLVLHVLKDFAEEMKGRNIVWEIQPLPHVQADRSLLRMVFVNFISNALKFTGGRAEARIEIGCGPNEEAETVIFIRDNGAGFDPKYADKLFGVFQRLHSHKEFEGTGIGLANIQRIIHRHGGRTWAESAVDAGATFYFSMPKRIETKK